MEKMSHLWILSVCVLMLCELSSANRAPHLTTTRTMIISGVSNSSMIITFQLRGQDPDGDAFTYRIITPPSSNAIKSIVMTSDGKLTLAQICDTCTGVVKFKIELTDSRGKSKTYMMTIKLQDRTGGLRMTEEVGPTAPKGLLRWHVYLIILAVIITVGVVTSLILYVCCTFQSHSYELTPLKQRKQKNKIGDGSGNEKEPRNVFTRPLSINNGSLEGVPYYGLKKQSLAGDNSGVNQPFPMRLMSISEEPGKRGSLLAPIRDPNSLLAQRGWRDISAPGR